MTSPAPPLAASLRVPGEHQHEWRVMDLCRDYCAGCPRLRRACPPRHDHTARASDNRRTLYGKDYWR